MKKIINKKMKNILFIAILAFSLNALAQPIIQDGSNVPSSGFSAPVSVIVSSSTDITNGGANHTWDFSAYTFNSAGTLNVIPPSSTPMGSSFPSANYAFSFAGTYSFFNVGSSKMEVQAWTITSAGSGNDYTPNPRTVLKFPFNFNDIETDTWQKVSGSPSTVTLYYDSYGTLITPSGTYTDVVRIRENYGTGVDDYQWYILNPLIPVAIFDHNTNTLYHIAATQVTGIASPDKNTFAFDIFPNPANEVVHITDLPIGSTVKILDVTGELAYSSAITNEQNTTINTTDLTNGIYLIRIENNGNIATRKLVVNK